MLVHLSIRDFAIIHRLELPLDSGMTVLTGETGAGKSILVDALSLALGERAQSATVRPGCERAEVSAVFAVADSPTIGAWLAEQELEASEAETILRRSVSTDGRSRAWINGRPVPVQVLKALGDQLVDIHGQHAHQSLLHRPAQRELLDAHARHGGALARLAELHRRWSAAQAELAGEEATPEEREQRRDFLAYQIEELRRLELKHGEPEALDQEHRRLSHASELLEVGHAALERLAGDAPTAVLGELAAVRRSLDALSGYDPRLREIAELLESAAIHVEESVGTLRRWLEELDLDPERHRWLEARLAALHDLARKHRVGAGELPALLERLETELEALEKGAERRETLARELEDLRRRYEQAARALHESRRRVAQQLSAAITDRMQALGMPGGRAEIAIEHQPGERLSPVGADQVEFRVSTHPGQPVLPLARVASGGELSRISLAIQVVASQERGVPTLIFDEVDAGIGGRVAEVVGQLLRRLAARRQVLCITHLPQVASQAHHHIQVQKHAEAASTRAELESLEGEDRVREIARMLGGLRITARTLAHAREMLERAYG